MQTELLDIIIIASLVLLFGSAYRKRPTAMVRAWMVGWILIVSHFGALLFHPASTAAQNGLMILSLTALYGCGVVFLLAPRRLDDRRRSLLVLPVLAGASAFGYTVLAVAAPGSLHAAYYLAAAVGVTCWVMYAFALVDLSRVVRVTLLLAIVACTVWLVWAIAHGQYDLGLSAILTQLFAVVGITYIGAIRRISAGCITVALSLMAWAAVFPAAEFCAHLGLAASISPELWNVPKYFVAFGMMLLLLEEEILAANDAGKTLFYQATHDQLTGLANRASLEHVLRESVDEARLVSGQCALISLDVDRFKHINDTYGHGVGDICLQTIGSRLGSLSCEAAAVARVGGEEFSVVLHHLARPGDAQAFAQKLQQAIQEPIQAEGFLLEVTASIGIAIFPFDGEDAEAIWKNADSAMYRAKKKGGNQFISMSAEILESTSEANQMERLLRTALQEGQLELHYQPIFRREGGLHSLEALVRLRHPELGCIAPSRFIPVAEERGLIVPLGQWVLNEVCRQRGRWQMEGIEAPPLTVNISAIQLTSPTFAANVRQTLSEFGVSPESIGMEITETAMMRNIAEAARQIDMLAAQGMSFSIDDFGMGYSSLGQLDRLPVHHLKIDRSFIERMCTFGEASSIVQAVISMAHGLGMAVVAEGVETQEQWQRLRELQCDLVQGFLFSTPLPAAEVAPLLARWRDEVWFARTDFPDAAGGRVFGPVPTDEHTQISAAA